MRAALLLRLREASRRGGVVAVLLGAAAVGAVAASGAGGYGLATDLAVAFGYLFALFQGALPLGADRERRRSVLQAASPSPAWAWALGNALGAASVAGAAMVLLLGAAGAGAALQGGIETRVARGFRDAGTLWLPLRLERREGDQRYRLATRVAPTGEVTGTPGEVTVRAGEATYRAPIGLPLEIPASIGDLVLRNETRGLHVGVVSSKTRALGAPRPFLANALLAGLGPALGAAALAAFAMAAGAHLSGPVAALLTALVLLLASMRGFLLDTLEHGGRMAEAAGQAERPKTSTALLKATLAAIPDLGALDGSARAAAGEWVGWREAGRGAALLAGALILAFAAGGLGVRLRRLE